MAAVPGPAATGLSAPAAGPAAIPANPAPAAKPPPCTTCKGKHGSDEGKTEEKTLPNGDKVSTTTFNDGTKQVITTRPDGSVTNVETRLGSTVTMTQDPKGNISSQTVETGSSKVAVDKWNVDGSQQHSTSDPGWISSNDKSVAIRADGTTTTTTTNAWGVGVVGNTTTNTVQVNPAGNTTYDSTSMSQYAGVKYVAQVNATESYAAPGMGGTYGLSAGAKVGNGLIADVGAGASVQGMNGEFVGGSGNFKASVADGWVGQVNGSGSSLVDPVTGGRSTSYAGELTGLKEISAGGEVRYGTINNINGVNTGSYSAGDAYGPFGIGGAGGYQVNNGVETSAYGTHALGSITSTTGPGGGTGLSSDPMGGIGQPK